MIALLSVSVAGCGLLVDLAEPPEGLPDSGTLDAAAVCGDGLVAPTEDCDDGNDVDGDGCDRDCAFSCESDADCDDGEACSVDACSREQHVCSHSVPGCPAPTACERFVGCDEGGACLLERVDEDGDGHAAESLGECGDDCDDDDEDVFTGASEVCDGVDQDCDDHIDEGVGTLCGQDLDGDGFGSTVMSSVLCDSAVCPEGYVTNADDCWDDDPAGFPPPGSGVPGPQLASPGLGDGVSGFREPRADGTGSYDWDCDGVEEPLWPDLFEACVEPPCPERSGWVAPTVAVCGERAAFVHCRASGPTACEPVIGEQTQACR